MNKEYDGTVNFPSSMSEKCKQVFNNGGLSRIFKYAFELGYHLVKPRTTFIFKDRKYKCFYHWYNTTWRGEREIELSIFLDILKKNTGSLLEFGNVLQNYINIKHDIVDRYEKANNVINEDIITFNPNKKYNTILSISTLEHVGWDETPRDPQKIHEAFNSLKKLLDINGSIIFSVPLGFNSYLDDLILNKKLVTSESHFFKRINGLWVEKKLEDVGSVNLHDDLFIGVIKND